MTLAREDAAEVLAMVSPFESLCEALGIPFGFANREQLALLGAWASILPRASIAAVRLVPFVKPEGVHWPETEHVVREWLRRAKDVRDQFIYRAHRMGVRVA